MKEYCFGIDVGGTTVKMGLFRVDGELLEKWEIPSRTENEGKAILPDIAEAVQKKLEERGIEEGFSRLVSVSEFRVRSMQRALCRIPQTLAGAIKRSPEN